MIRIDFQKPDWVHFIGIGGISMSGLAELLHSWGFRVSGSDIAETPLTQKLRRRGIQVTIGQRAENIRPGMHIAVYTAAVHLDNPEFQAAVNAGLAVLSRAELLGQIMENYADSIAVAGTHGKTTTTGMLAEILLAAGTDPTVSLGGMLDSIGGNLRIGHSEYFLAEACEYTNSFLSFYPRTGIILNIREDHLDFFKDLDDIRRSFRLFAENIPAGGRLIIGSGIEDAEQLMAGIAARLIRVGFQDDDEYRAVNQRYSEMGHAEFDLYHRNEDLGHISLQIPGHHNIYNALAAAAAVLEDGIPFEAVQQGLARFGGTHRRFEIKGVLPSDVLIVDDYAHHPDEIVATLKAARCYHRRINCIFQPHTYSRTKALFSRFAEALGMCDRVVLTDIYPARETDTLGMHSSQLAERLSADGTEAYYLGGFERVVEYVRREARPGDMWITMGAGDVFKIGEELVKR
ncbi:MAG: UDP-N-acetylmuramate--L-alanine ligase [Lachnospiraceae bacterium]|nr:UDP-N-acetylmuramate--L-alanine ligase [Lachnospiraceae bacterium]